MISRPQQGRLLFSNYHPSADGDQCRISCLACRLLHNKQHAAIDKWSAVIVTLSCVCYLVLFSISRTTAVTSCLWGRRSVRIGRCFRGTWRAAWRRSNPPDTNDTRRSAASRRQDRLSSCLFIFTLYRDQSSFINLRFMETTREIQEASSQWAGRMFETQ